MPDVSTTTEPKKKDRVFHRYGDRELWLASGPTWQLPLMVEWFLEDGGEQLHTGLVYPACVVYMSQAMVLTELIGTYDMLGRSDRWLVPRKIVETMLKKAPGLTPLYYYQWPDEQCPGVLAARTILVPPEEELRQEKASAQSERFFSHLSRQHSIPVSMIRVVWNAVTTEGAAWMLNSRGVIDLGFVKLFAAPFRVNWKQIVAWKCRRWGLATIFRMPKEDMHEALEAHGFDEVLCSLHNLGLAEPKTRGDVRLIDYTLEAVPTKAFAEAAHEAERYRWAGGWRSYVEAIEETIEIHYDNLVAALRSYFKKGRLPFARLYEGGDARSTSLLPALQPNDKVRGASLRNLPVDIVETGRRCSLLQTRRAGRTIPPAPLQVQEVPPLSQGPDDVRRRDGAEPAGLPVLDAGEGNAAGESVLPCTENDGGSPRLDGKGNQ